MVVYPRQPDEKPFTQLRRQMESFGIPIVTDMPASPSRFDVMIDALFGYKFKG